jgi:hypothetical protein
MPLFRPALYRRQLRRATPSWVDWHALNAIHHTAPLGYQVDHIVPLNGKNVCGLNVPWNLQYMVSAANLAKGNRLTEAQDGQGTHEFVAACVALFDSGLGWTIEKIGKKLMLMPEVRFPRMAQTHLGSFPPRPGGRGI